MANGGPRRHALHPRLLAQHRRETHRPPWQILLRTASSELTASSRHWASLLRSANSPPIRKGPSHVRRRTRRRARLEAEEKQAKSVKLGAPGRLNLLWSPGVGQIRPDQKAIQAYSVSARMVKTDCRRHSQR